MADPTPPTASKALTTRTPSPQLSERLRGLLLSGERVVVGPETRAELARFIDVADAAEPPRATIDEIEQSIALLSQISKQRPLSVDEARTRLELYGMALDDVPGADLRRALRELVRKVTFMPTPAEVRAEALRFTSRRRYAVSRARALVALHDREYEPPRALLPPIEAARCIAEIKAELAAAFASESEARP